MNLLQNNILVKLLVKENKGNSSYIYFTSSSLSFRLRTFTRLVDLTLLSSNI